MAMSRASKLPGSCATAEAIRLIENTAMPSQRGATVSSRWLREALNDRPSVIPAHVGIRFPPPGKDRIGGQVGSPHDWLSEVPEAVSNQPAKEEMPCRFTRKETSEFAMRKPAPVSLCFLRPVGGSTPASAT